MDKAGENRQPQQSTGPSDFDVEDLNQVRNLVDTLSPQEKNEVVTILRSCAGETTLKRGVPLALLVVGGMHFMREKLPVHLQSGFRKFLFQGMVVSGAVMFSNILFPSTCFDKVKPKLLEFHQRHNQPGVASRYDQLRNANRHKQQPLPSQYHLTTPPPVYNAQPGQQPAGNYAQPAEAQPLGEPQELESPPQGRFIYDDSSSYYMSGTPARSTPLDSETGSATNMSPPPKLTSNEGFKSKSKNAYGDEGFS